ncbi:NPC intracellular cholesterol transporter 1-like isoform X2 [Ostrea edulis]|uniref:NPC intracellular cholesterol transporter 1-like isoform X2 n=1 Tax=Ostrea edulis TaxID=37623 RepID=UPI0024AEC363|nr:NPC intracellular cholesterol transporter 1-like isoform X2 [Ostrea edulis]
MNGHLEKKPGMNEQVTTNGQIPVASKEKKKPNIVQRVANKIVWFFETGFERIGVLISTHPWKTILISTIITGLFCIGAGVNFTETNDNSVIWVPSDAEVVAHKKYVESAYPSTTRFFYLMLVNSNVMTQTSIQNMYNAYETITNLSTGSTNYSTICQKSGGNCLVTSVLELWSYDSTTIAGLTDQSIKDDVNNTITSPLYKSPWEASKYLGGRTVSGSEITAASAAIITFFIDIDDDNKTVAEAWEQLALDTAKNGFQGFDITYYFATRSRSDEAGDAIRKDVSLLSAGYFLVIVYLFIVLGRLNCVEQRIGLSLAGIIVIGMSIGFSFGLSSAAGWEYGPLHSILPFLLLGIGVDDMFVVVGSYQSLSHHELSLPLNERMGKLLRHAGVSVLVTSVTDILAFGIGATTTLPALRSFCIFACLGILGLFSLAITFFLACLTLDIMRTEQGRNACICCYKQKPDYKPNACSQRNLFNTVLRKYYTKILLKLPVKIGVVVITLGLLGLNIWGFYSLKQDYDDNWFFPTDSYAYEFNEMKDKYFPGGGASGGVYCKNIDYFNSKTKFETLYNQTTSNQYIATGSVDSWFQSYTDWLETNPAAAAGKVTNNYPNTEADFADLLYTFLNNENNGKRHLREVVFQNNSGTLDITTTYVSYQHTVFDTASDEIVAMDAMVELVKGIFSETECFPYSRLYLQWETNKVIKSELFRNLGLASACVFVITLVLIANLWTSLLVFTCVIMTLVDVAGIMHLWGLSINIVSCINLVIAIGLAVDYSAHIGHCFMTFVGDRNERVRATLVEMGNPVFSGGFSTFLAFILLAASKSYVFTTFFQIFLLVVVFGLFHGLVYLPVLLSWIGPSAYTTADRRYKDEDLETGDSKGPALHGHDNLAMKTNISNGRASEPPPDYQHKDLPYIPPPDYSPPTKPRSQDNGRVSRMNGLFMS